MTEYAVTHGPDWSRVWNGQKAVVHTPEDRKNPFKYPCRCGFLAKSQSGRTRHCDRANFNERLNK